MPKSRNRSKRNRHRRSLAQLIEELGPDRTIPLHVYDDGWRIVVIPDVTEAHREGRLMHLCMRRRETADYVFPVATMPRIGGAMLSLRDQDGYPHLTFLHDPDHGLTHMADGYGCAAPTPPSQRCDGASWAVHNALAAQADRFDLIDVGMTVRQAEQIVRDRGRLDGRHRVKLGRVRHFDPLPSQQASDDTPGVFDDQA